MPHLKEKTYDHSRRLTISSKYRRRLNQKNGTVPELRLCGNWLGEAGFVEGEAVEVEVYNNELRIKLYS